MRGVVARPVAVVPPLEHVWVDTVDVCERVTALLTDKILQTIHRCEQEDRFNPQAVFKGIDQLAKHIGYYEKDNVLVSNAAGGARTVSGTRGSFTAIDDTSTESWDGTMTVNLRGAFLGTKLAIPEMRKTGGGSIIITSSQLGMVGSDNNGAAYHASTGAVTRLSRRYPTLLCLCFRPTMFTPVLI